MKQIVFFLLAFFVAFSIKAQPTVKNPSNGMSVELSYNGRQMILRPAESKAIYFMPPSGEVRNVRLRYFVGKDIKTVFTTDLNIVSGQELVLPLSAPEKTLAHSRADQQKQPNQIAGSSIGSSMPGFSPKIPEVSGVLEAKKFPLILVDSTQKSILVFEGDFYGAALAPNEKTEPIITGPGIISMKILYDADPPASSSGRNLWQCPVQGIVTQGQEYFVLRENHLRNLQRDVAKVVFFNPTPYSMVPEGLDIDPIPPNRRSNTVRLNQGFNNFSFVYINEAGVKVRAVFELVVTKGTPVVRLNLNPLGNAYGVTGN
ncbi:MAG TPA: hypothetical protein PK086_00025 [bacterium]|nr:hypothetical protein [bacterium]HQQ37950.1 hypothetical protein [bacterium]